MDDSSNEQQQAQPSDTDAQPEGETRYGRADLLAGAAGFGDAIRPHDVAGALALLELEGRGGDAFTRTEVADAVGRFHARKVEG